MACYYPRVGYKSARLTKNGKSKIVFRPDEAVFAHMPIQLPCGQCIGCKLERSRQWAIRCVHEASLYDDNMFLTLTYDDEHLPKHGTLVKKHFQDFMKRYRKCISPKKIRYFMCGEYGEENMRPHYHAIIFNHFFEDAKIHKKSQGYNLWTSEKLDELWQKGYSLIGSVTFDSAAYVARYILKKVTGSSDEANDRIIKRYTKCNPDTMENHRILMEYSAQSRRPGIGADYMESYKMDIYKNDSVIQNGKEVVPPKFYDSRFEIENPEEYKRIKEKRRARMGRLAHNKTPERLRASEKVKMAQLALKQSKL